MHFYRVIVTLGGGASRQQRFTFPLCSGCSRFILEITVWFVDQIKSSTNVTPSAFRPTNQVRKILKNPKEKGKRRKLRKNQRGGTNRTQQCCWYMLEYVKSMSSVNNWYLEDQKTHGGLGPSSRHDPISRCASFKTSDIKGDQGWFFSGLKVFLRPSYFPRVRSKMCERWCHEVCGHTRVFRH